MPLSAVLTTITIERCHADERRDGAAIQSAELRQFREQRARGGGPDTGHALKQIVLHAPDRTRLDGGASLIIDIIDAPFEPPNMIPEVACDAAGWGRLFETPLLHAEHLEQLPAASDESGQRVRLRVCDRSCGRLHTRTKVGQHRRIHRVSFGGAAERLRERADLTRIHDGHRQARCRTRRDERTLIPTGRFDDDDRGRQARRRATNVSIAAGVVSLVHDSPRGCTA